MGSERPLVDYHPLDDRPTRLALDHCQRLRHRKVIEKGAKEEFILVTSVGAVS